MLPLPLLPWSAMIRTPLPVRQGQEWQIGTPRGSKPTPRKLMRMQRVRKTRRPMSPRQWPNVPASGRNRPQSLSDGESDGEVPKGWPSKKRKGPMDAKDEDGGDGEAM